MTRPMNPATALRLLAQDTPDRDAIVFADQRVSYRNLLDLTEAFALRLRALGVGPGSTVHLDSREVIAIAPMLLASALLGASFLQNVGALDQPGLPAVTHAFAGPEAPARGYPVVTLGPDWSPRQTRDEGLSWDPAWDVRDPDAPLLIVYTSGTTGLPKFLALTQAMVAARSAAVSDEFLPGQTRLAALFPADSRPFLARLMAVVWNGATLVAETDPAHWSALGVNRVSASAGQAMAVFSKTVLSPRLPVIEVSGARIEDADVLQILRSFELVDDTYGASETNKTFSHFKTRSDSGQVLTEARPRDSEIRILRPDGTPAAIGEAGEVAIRNPYLATAYLNAPEASARAFRAGWFYPGDVASFGPDGRFHVQPRSGAITNRGGAKVGLAAIDTVLCSVEGIRDAVTFPSPKPEAAGTFIAFAVFDEDVNRAQVAARARAACIDMFGPDLAPYPIRPIDRVPRLPDGTPDRDACQQMVLAALANKPT